MFGVKMFDAIFSILGSMFNRYQERKQSEQQVKMAELEAKRAIALDTVKAELELGKTQVKATSQYFKYMTFFMWFGPFFLSYVAPSYGVLIFDNLSKLPEWYVQSCMVIMFAIWGIQAGKESILAIFQHLGVFFSRRHETSLKRDLFYKTLRSTKGPLGQAEVDLYEKAFNNMFQKD
jgi:hypothetical protein